MNIRRATEADAEALAELGVTTFIETFGHLYPPSDLELFLTELRGIETVRPYLCDAGKAAWLVEADGEPVGYALAGPCGLPHGEPADGHGELKQLYLLKRRQSGGTGARLMAEVMAWLEAEGFDRACLGVWSGNLGAQRFYARHGFTKVGEFIFPVGETRDAEFIFSRPLP